MTKAPKKTGRISREELHRLKRGEDRDGQPRTWAEVAKVLGLNPYYVERVANNRRFIPEPVHIDPRQYRPQLADLLTDEDVAAWQANPHCLCGCGQPSLQELSGDSTVPYGAFRLFRRAHEARMPWRRAQQVELNKHPERIRVVSASIRAQTVRTDAIAEILIEWRRTHGQTNWLELAERSGISRGHITDIASGRLKRIRRVTAARLLVAMDEPLRPEIATAYRQWCRANGIRHGKLNVEARPSATTDAEAEAS